MKVYRNTLIDIVVVFAFSIILSVFSVASYGQVGSGKPSTSDLNMQNHVIRNSTYYGTGAFGTASAESTNVTGTARAVVQLVTTPSSSSISVAGASTANTISTSVAGGVYNGDFSLGTSGWADLWNGGTAYWSVANQILTVSGQAGNWSMVYCTTEKMPRIYPSTKYKLSMQTMVTGGTFDYGYLNYDINGVIGTESYTTFTNTAWTTVSKEFTSDSDAFNTYIAIRCNSQLYKCYVKNIKLEQIDTQIATAPPIDTFVYPSITGVTSEFVDQSNWTGSSALEICKTDTRQFYQSFTATKSNVSAIQLLASKVGSPTNVMVDLYTDNANRPDTLIASYDASEFMTLSTYPTYGYITIPIYGLTTPGVKYGFMLRAHTNSASNHYFVSASSSSVYTEGAFYYSYLGAWYFFGDLKFDVKYAQNTNNVAISTSDAANTTNISFGDTGLPDGATIDLERGKFSVTYPNTSAGLYQQLGTIIQASHASVAGTSKVLNGYLPILSSGKYIFYGNSIPNGTITWCINTGAPIIDSATITIIKYSWSYLDYSKDGVNWVEVDAGSGSTLAYSTYVITGLRGSSSFFIKIGPRVGSDYLAASLSSIQADIDTSQLNLPVLTPTGGNDLYASVNGGSYKAGLSSKYYSNSLYTASELNQQEISKIQASAQATRDRITPVTSGIIGEGIMSVSGALQRGGFVVDASNMWWFPGEVSAAQFTDRTPYFTGDSIAEIMAVTTIPGTNEIDHKSLGSARVPVAPEQELKFMDVLDATGDLIVRVPGGIPIREITETIPAQKLTTLENTMLLEESVMLDDFSPGLGRQAFSGLEYSDETPEGYSIPARDILVATEEYSFSEALASVGIPEASAAEIRNTTKIIQYDRRDIGWSVSRLEDAIRTLEYKIKSLESQ